MPLNRKSSRSILPPILGALSLGATLCVSLARAGIPDPSCPEVHPADELNGVVVSPSVDHPLPASILHILIKDVWTCLPVANLPVVVLLTSNNPICPSAVLDGVTDANGRVDITVAASGCAHQASAAVIKAGGVTIRAYPNCKSPDYDGSRGNGVVALPDLIAFAQEFNGLSTELCHDYDNTGSCGLADLTIFGPAFSSALHCP
ncbi:MAG: hypothetical protein U0527_06355 [Candidatus Eisenbacteria bacterium]